MTQINPQNKVYFISRGIIVFWLLVLTVLLLMNQRTTKELSNNQQRLDTGIQIHALQSQIDVLSSSIAEQRHTLETLQTRFISQTDLTDAQQEIYVRIASTQQQLDGFALISDLESIKSGVQTLAVSVQKLNEQMTAKMNTEPVSSDKNETLPNPQRPQSTQPPKPSAPPFKVLGIERRGDTFYIAVIPNGKHSMQSIQLIRVGERIGHWQLESINGSTAIFKVGSLKRHIAIPQSTE